MFLWVFSFNSFYLAKTNHTNIMMINSHLIGENMDGCLRAHLQVYTDICLEDRG